MSFCITTPSCFNYFKIFPNSSWLFLHIYFSEWILNSVPQIPMQILQDFDWGCTTLQVGYKSTSSQHQSFHLWTYNLYLGLLNPLVTFCNSFCAHLRFIIKHSQSLISSHNFSVDSPAIVLQRMFCHPLPNIYGFSYFSYCICYSKTCKTILNSLGDSGHSRPSHIQQVCFNTSPLSNFLG